jgi:hypothetical protein
MARIKGLPVSHKPEDHKDRWNIKYCDNFLCKQAWEKYQERVSADEVVQCDTMCGAPDKPATGQEYRAAYWHWRDHSVMSGCSHGQ